MGTAKRWATRSSACAQRLRAHRRTTRRRAWLDCVTIFSGGWTLFKATFRTRKRPRRPPRCMTPSTTACRERGARRGMRTIRPSAPRARLARPRRHRRRPKVRAIQIWTSRPSPTTAPTHASGGVRCAILDSVYRSIPRGPAPLPSRTTCVEAPHGPCWRLGRHVSPDSALGVAEALCSMWASSCRLCTIPLRRTSIRRRSRERLM